MSDRHLTVNSGFLDKLMHGNLVLVDRGFDIADDLALFGASLTILCTIYKGKVSALTERSKCGKSTFTCSYSRRTCYWKNEEF